MKVQEYLEQYRKSNFPDNDWLHPIRTAAVANLEELRFPAVKDENWKYTRASLFLKDDFEISMTPGILASEKITPHVLTSGEVLVFIDGFYAPEFSNVNIAKALQQSLNHPLVKLHLSQIADNKASGFMALNTAMMHDGAFLHITGIVAEPIQILHINTGKKIINHYRNLIVADKNSQASIIESYVSLEKNSKYFNNVVTEISLADNANITVYKIQHESLGAQHLSSTYVQQQRDSSFNHLNVDIGSQVTRNWLQCNLNAENAHSNFNGLYLIAEQQHIDNHTRVEHNAAHTTSGEHYKGILTEQCRGVFNGQVYIAKNSQKTSAQQQNANLLLGQNAEIDTKPQLEIYADDVKCSHGATIGQLDYEALFYLQSRGLSHATARNILTYGFAKEIIDKISHEPLRDYLTKKLLSWLPNGKQLTELL